MSKPPFREVTIKHIGKQRKHWFLKVELAILVCVICIWAVKLVTIDIDSAKATTDSEAFEHLLAGNDYYDSNQPKEAIRCYKEAIRVAPYYFDAHLNLGDVYYGSGRYAQATEHFKEAVKIEPDSTWARTCLGLAYSDWGRCDAAVEVYTQTIKHDPDVADAVHLLIGNAYAVSDRYEEATRAYGQAIEIDAGIVEAHYRLAKVYLTMGNKDLALEEYEILKTLDEELADELSFLIHEPLETSDE